MPIDPTALNSFAAVAVGFAFAGLSASAFEWALSRPLGLANLQEGGPRAYATVPVLVASAPVLILRAILRKPPRARPNAAGIMLATVSAGMWSSLSGRLVLDLTQLLAGA